MSTAIPVQAGRTVDDCKVDAACDEAYARRDGASLSCSQCANGVKAILEGSSTNSLVPHHCESLFRHDCESLMLRMTLW